MTLGEKRALWSPEGLAEIRRAIGATVLRTPRTDGGAIPMHERIREQRMLLSGSLWWIPASQSTQLVADAAAAPDGFVLDEVIPDRTGLMAIDGFGVPHDFGGRRMRAAMPQRPTIDAYMWLREPGRAQYAVVAYSRLVGVDRHRLGRASWGKCPLVVLDTFWFPVGQRFDSVASEDGTVTPWQLLYAVFTATADPLYVEHVRTPATGTARAPRPGRPEDDVRIIRVPRRVYVDPGTGSSAQRAEPGYRWKVREHPVTVWCGKGRAEKRVVMRREHVRGPANKPLREDAAVHVLSRPAPT